MSPGRRSRQLGDWMGGPGMRFRLFRCPWFSGLAILLELVETTGVWPQGRLDAFFAMIPKATADSTPKGQRTLRVLPVVYSLWASLRLGHLREWVEGWLPTSVFSLVMGCRLLRRGSPQLWILRRFFLGLVVISCMLWSLMSLVL